MSFCASLLHERDLSMPLDFCLAYTDMLIDEKTSPLVVLEGIPLLHSHEESVHKS